MEILVTFQLENTLPLLVCSYHFHSLWCADYFPTRLTSKSHDGPQPQGNKDKAKAYPPASLTSRTGVHPHHHRSSSDSPHSANHSTLKLLPKPPILRLRIQDFPVSNLFLAFLSLFLHSQPQPRTKDQSPQSILSLPFRISKDLCQLPTRTSPIHLSQPQIWVSLRTSSSSLRMSSAPSIHASRSSSRELPVALSLPRTSE